MKQASGYIVGFLVLVLGFQNCSGYFSTGGDFHKSSECGASPSEMVPTFRTTYQPFFATNTCTKCHAPGGEKSDSPFADSNALTAVSAFERVGGPLAVERKLAASHQGYNFQTLKPDLDAAKDLWFAQGFGECASGLYTTSENFTDFYEDIADPGTGKFKVKADSVNAPQTLVFPLDDTTFDPPIPGASVSVQVEVISDADGFPIYYAVRNVLFSSEQTLEVEGIKVLLNGSNYNQNTWASAKGFVTGDNSPLIGAEAQIQIFKASDETYSRTDAWSLSFQSITIKDF